MELRQKSSSEIADLESIAQAHYSRANRLSDELNYLRADYLELKQQVLIIIKSSLRKKFPRKNSLNQLVLGLWRYKFSF